MDNFQKNNKCFQLPYFTIFMPIWTSTYTNK